MSHYTLEDLIARWKREELSVEQMIGQFALVLAAQEQRLRALERRVPEEPVVEIGSCKAVNLPQRLKPRGLYLLFRCSGSGATQLAD